MGFQFFKKFGVDDPILVDHEDVFNWDHLSFNFFQTQVDSVLQYFDLFWTIAVLLAVVKQQN